MPVNGDKGNDIIRDANPGSTGAPAAVEGRTGKLERIAPSIENDGYLLRGRAHRDIPVPPVGAVSQRGMRRGRMHLVAY